MLRAIEAVGWDPCDVAVVSGIGCTSRAPGYINMNTLHTTHGRALTFATGMKLARPDKHVVVISGDGDAAAIGGNHFIHSCRRNIDITCIVVNNHIYGMTGGQYSPTTPLGYRAETAPYGMVEPPFDLAQLAIGAGATYVARGHVGSAVQLERLIRNGLKHRGFAVIEALSNCHTHFGRKNRMPDPIELIEFISSRTINIKEASKLPPEELKGKYVVGLLHQDTSREEYCEAYFKMVKRVRSQN